MTLGAVGDVMTFGQREEVVVDTFGRPVFAINLVTFNTVGGKTGIHMVRIGRGVKLIEVAIDTVIPYAVELKFGFGSMTVFTTDRSMHAHEREAIVLVYFRDIIDQPVLGGMAAGTIGAHR